MLVKFISDGVGTTNSAGKVMDGKGNIVNEADVVDELNKLSENTSGILNSVSGITNNRSAQQQQQQYTQQQKHTTISTTTTTTTISTTASARTK